jgi:iron complex outermembrane recepter protein
MQERKESSSLRFGTLASAVAGILCVTSGTLVPNLIGVHAQEAEAESGDDVASLSGITVTDDPLRVLSDEPSGSSFGFSKPLLETPRSVSFISEEQISMFGVSTVEDLTRLVPGTYTTTRYGLQGGINVRGVSSDMYYRGMRRLQMQGHVRTVLSAMDGIEVVKGPPSPIYGMGRIGGYQNLDPKSSRAKTGAYLSSPQGFVQTTQGTYDRNEVQGGIGGPFSPFGKQGGYYVFGLVEDSDSWVKQVGAKQRFLQTTVAIENFAGPFRLEFGGQLQNSVTSGAYMNRVTQDLLDHGTYISGQPMVNLDLDGDGQVGYVEAYTGSPVLGDISSSNAALNQTFDWPTDADGNLIPVQQFESVPGIPQTMLDYLNAHPEIDCRAADVMRSMPVGGPVPLSGQLPVGFVLDPCTVEEVPVDYRGNGSYEREQNADQKLFYIDFIYDANPDFTIKNQIMYDNISSFKDSFLPYGENQYIKAIEDKFTVTKRISDTALPDWVRINTLASLNYRRTQGWIRSSGGDFDWRQDIMFNGGYHYPNTMFWTQLTNPDYATGALDTRNRSSKYDSTGLGVLFDIDLLRNTNVVIGGRYDTSDAEASDQETFNESAGVSPAPGAVCTEPGPGCPGAYAGAPRFAEGSDSGNSWSISHAFGGNWRPYLTFANSSLQLSSSNDLIDRSAVSAGHIGEAELKEIGIKGSFLGGKFVWTSAAYEQTRTDVRDPEDPTEGADVSSSLSRGVETEIKWLPTRDFFLSVYYLTQHSEYTVDSGSNLYLNAQQIGFQDVVDPVTGAVLYPAEAFFYGGKARIDLPANQMQFRERVGNPKQQAGFNGTYTFQNGLRVLFGGTWFSEVWADRAKTLEVPEALVLNAGVDWSKGPWNIRLNGYNIDDERYFRPRSGDSNATLMSSMPGTRWEFTAKHEFR